MRIAPAFVLSTVVAVSAWAAYAQPALQVQPSIVSPIITGSIQHAPINEQSGLVKSRHFKDTWWVHNDSGDIARIFAVKLDGSVIYPPFLRDIRTGKVDPKNPKVLYQGIPVDLAANHDWEDITTGTARCPAPPKPTTTPAPTSSTPPPGRPRPPPG